MSPCQGAYAHGEVCRLDEDRAGIGAYCPIGSMVRESYDYIIGDASPGAIPFHRLFGVGDSLRRHAYAAIAGGMMSTRKLDFAQKPDKL